MATATSANHILCLSKLCRLCGNYIGADSFYVINIIARVDEAFLTEIGEDRTEIHPPKICMKCYTLMRHIEQRGTTSFNFILINWSQTCSLKSLYMFCKEIWPKEKETIWKTTIS